MGGNEFETEHLGKDSDTRHGSSLASLATGTHATTTPTTTPLPNLTSELAAVTTSPRAVNGVASLAGVQLENARRPRPRSKSSHPSTTTVRPSLIEPRTSRTFSPQFSSADRRDDAEPTGRTSFLPAWNGRLFPESTQTRLLKLRRSSPNLARRLPTDSEEDKGEDANLAAAPPLGRDWEWLSQDTAAGKGVYRVCDGTSQGPSQDHGLPVEEANVIKRVVWLRPQVRPRQKYKPLRAVPPLPLA
ncbi:hypothetical protein JCM3766R1_006576 [Sporobolomyces carnicolor]